MFSAEHEPELVSELSAIGKRGKLLLSTTVEILLKP